MRAISPHGRYSIQLVEAHPKRGVDATGTVVEYSDTKPIIAPKVSMLRVEIRCEKKSWMLQS